RAPGRIAAFEDVPEPGHDEGHRSVVPARIEAHQARIAVKLDGRAVPSGGRKRNAVETFWPNRSTRMRMANSERSEGIGYSSRTSSTCGPPALLGCHPNDSAMTYN